MILVKNQTAYTHANRLQHRTMDPIHIFDLSFFNFLFMCVHWTWPQTVVMSWDRALGPSSLRPLVRFGTESWDRSRIFISVHPIFRSPFLDLCFLFANSLTRHYLGKRVVPSSKRTANRIFRSSLCLIVVKL